ncbi:MAG: hypothetical protein K8S54_17725 [Spirochaetia bacterium]|nr:hypothetical protein [Spirochaetia bacterium]
MKAVSEIEREIRELPQAKQWELVSHLADELWSHWDTQIESDSAKRLNNLILEARADITSGEAKPLDEILNNP